MDHDTAYPEQWETHAVLKDGSTVEIRPIRETDRAALAEFHSRQSRESIYFRFFRYRPELTDKELDYFTTVDYRDRMAFVALLGSKLVAVARYEKWKDRQAAEVAFFVDDDHHGQGLATLMLEFLAAAGRDRRLSGFTATVLPENYRMLAVFRSAGFAVETKFADGLIEVELGLDVTEETSSAIADRHRLATARSVARILEPKSVAVIGASRTAGTVGHELVRNLASALGSASGRLFPVNPNATEIRGIPAFKSIDAASGAFRSQTVESSDSDRPGAGGVASTDDTGGERDGIDLAVIAVRASLVEDVVGQCAGAGVKGLLIISNGFAESSEAGVERQERVVDVARTNGMRLIGPNAFGLVNTAEDVRLRALFHPVPVSAGRVALGSESGPLGAALLERIRASGIGVSSFVGIGNRADVSVNDLLDYWSLDTNTEAVVLYVENFGNLRNFSAAAKRTSLAKPIITIGNSSADLSELLRQGGVIVVDQVSQLADQALLAASQPVARGDRVTIVANAASVARLATEACRRHGLEVIVPASVSGMGTEDSVLVGDLDSVSLMPSGDPADYERLIVAAAVSDEVDLILVALAPTAYLPAEELSGLLDRVNRSIDKPIAAIGLVGPELLNVERLPVFTFPEEAAQALGRHAAYGIWRAENGEAEMPTTALSGAETAIDAVLHDRDQVELTMATPEMAGLIEALGLPVAPYRTATDLAGVEAAAEALGYPLVVKAGNMPIRSLGESGGAAIDIHTNAALVASYQRMADQLGQAMEPTIIQRMIPSGTLLRVELVQDGSLGSLISVGSGGTGRDAAEASARRFLPFGQTTAADLIDEVIAAGVLLDADIEARAKLVEIILALGVAAASSDQLARILLNPIIVAGPLTAPADIEITLRRRPSDLLAGLRHLP